MCRGSTTDIRIEARYRYDLMMRKGEGPQANKAARQELTVSLLMWIDDHDHALCQVLIIALKLEQLESVRRGVSVRSVTSPSGVQI